MPVYLSFKWVIHTAIKVNVLRESSIGYMPLRDWVISENCYIYWMWWVDGAFLLATVATWTFLQNTHRTGSGWLPNQHFLRAIVSDCNVSILDQSKCNSMSVNAAAGLWTFIPPASTPLCTSLFLQNCHLGYQMVFCSV